MNIKAKRLTENLFTILISLSLMLMVLGVFINAVLRYGFNSGIPEMEELARYFMIWASALGTVMAYKEGKHIGVDLLISVLKDRPRSILLAIGHFITAAVFILVAWGGIEYFKTSANSPGPATGIPFGYISISIVVIAVAIVVMSTIDLVRDVRLALRRAK